MNNKTEAGFEDVSQPIPEEDQEFQELLKKSTKMPSDFPDSLKNPPNLEDIINEE